MFKVVLNIILCNFRNELIIFKRAMRQVSKDELERVVSHIAAYQREEFAEFLQV